MDNLTQLKQWKNKLAQIDRDQAQAQARAEMHMEKVRSFGANSIEEGMNILNQMNEKLTSLESEADKQFQWLQNEMNKIKTELGEH